MRKLPSALPSKVTTIMIILLKLSSRPLHQWNRRENGGLPRHIDWKETLALARPAWRKTTPFDQPKRNCLRLLLQPSDKGVAKNKKPRKEEKELKKTLKTHARGEKPSTAYCLTVAFRTTPCSSWKQLISLRFAPEVPATQLPTIQKEE